MSVFVGTEEIARREIKGDFTKFTYFCNGHPCTVYCYRSIDFLKLVNQWNKMGYNGKYVYHYQDDLGVPIALTDIPADQNFKVKLLLTDIRCNVTYIQ